MKYIHRYLEKKLLELVRYYPVVVVLGARQVGKSTMVQELFKGRMKTVVFDPVQDIGNARKDPDFFLQNHRTPLFLDEIQYAPELIPSIKRKVDLERKNGAYVLSGSQNLSVLRNISESLAGRAAIIHLQPMSFKEREDRQGASFISDWVQGKASDFKKYDSKEKPVYEMIWRGGHPKILQLPDRLVMNYWESYMQTYIERDVRTVADIGSLQDFGSFVSMLASNSSREINYTQIGRELGIDRKTAMKWTDIAVATYQWIKVPAYSRNPVKRILGKGKGYFADTGFICYLQKITDPSAISGHPLRGILFETFVATEIFKRFQKMDFSPNAFHYRTYAGAEVDLLLELNGTLFPIEIKCTSNPSAQDAYGIRSLRECFPKENIGNGLIVCGISEPASVCEGVIAIPWWMM